MHEYTIEEYAAIIQIYEENRGRLPWQDIVSLVQRSFPRQSEGNIHRIIYTKEIREDKAIRALINQKLCKN